MIGDFEIFIVVSVLMTLPMLFLDEHTKIGKVFSCLALSSVLVLSGALTYLGELEIGNILFLFDKKMLVVQALGVIVFLHNLRSYVLRNLTNVQIFVSNILYISIIFMFSSLDFLSLYFSLATLTICTIYYSLRIEVTSSLSFLIQSVVAELFLIAGILFFIAATGSINVININIINHEYIALSYIFFLAYTLFKLALFPFHSWLPIISKTAGEKLFLIFAVNITAYGLVLIPLMQKLLLELEPKYQDKFTLMISAIVIAGTFYGLLMSWRHKRIEKSFAYFSIVPISLVTLSIIIEPSDDLFLKQIYYFLFTGLSIGLGHVFINELLIENENTNTSKIDGAFFSSRIKSILLIIILLSLLGLPFTAGFSIRSGLLLSYFEAGLTNESLIIFSSSVLGLFIVFEYISQLFKKDNSSYPREIIGNNFPAYLIEMVIIVSVIIVGVIPTIK